MTKHSTLGFSFTLMVAATLVSGCATSHSSGADAGHQRDEGALDLLVRMLDVDEERLREAAHQSLVLITRQDFGRSRDGWAAWASEHRGTHRIEWLIEALMHEDAKLRRLAGDELKHLTQAYYGYQHALPKRDREVAQRKYRQWWESEGRALFR